MIWPQKFVRLRSRLITQFSRQVWSPQKFVLKLRRVQRKLHRVQLMLLTVQNAHNLHKRLHLQPFVPLIPAGLERTFAVNMETPSIGTLINCHNITDKQSYSSQWRASFVYSLIKILKPLFIFNLDS